MKNRLEDLNNYLFETLEVLMDEELTDAEMTRAVKKAEVVSKVSEQIIKTANLRFKGMVFAEKCSKQVPDFIEKKDPKRSQLEDMPRIPPIVKKSDW